MNDRQSMLAWLPSPPVDFGERLKSATASDLRALAGYALDDNQLVRLARRVAALEKLGADFGRLEPFTLGIVSNSTTQLLAPALVATGLRFGFHLRVVEAGYNHVAQEAFGHSSLGEHNLDAVLVALDYRGLPLPITPGDRATADATVAECVSYLGAVTDRIRENTGALVILQNIAPPVDNCSGSIERRLPGTLSWLVAQINQQLDAQASGELLILDVAGVASGVGLNAWHDETLWNMAKLPFALEFVPLYADHVGRIISACRGKSRRCLILDLDDTLWGGVIGDDGLDGIVIGQGNATGEAHLRLQQAVLQLRDRGVVLCICSKNEDGVARKPFREHPDMLLREDHIAVFQANWTDKARNIRAIADALSLGLESMVFLDDNPAERLQVRQELPAVAVPELPGDPALFGRTLLAAGYFEAITFSGEDRMRAALYQQREQRTRLFQQASDMEGYLRSLQMEIVFAPFDAVGRSRIVQLIGKSNQFNLTTRRYNEQEIRQLELDEGTRVFTRQVRLTDVLGDNGMISLVICRMAGDVWHIDTWLMSCRVLGRRVEEAVLEEIVCNAERAGVRCLVGRYIPTPRNVLVKDHYRALGFVKTAGDDSGEEVWELDLARARRPDVPMTVKHAV